MFHIVNLVLLETKARRAKGHDSMAGKTAGEIFSGGGDPFVNADMKRALAEAGVPFGITGASAKSRNQFGDDETSFTIEVSAKAAKAAGDDELSGVWKLSMSHNDVRERQANDVIAALGVPGTDKIGPVFLQQVTTKSGQHAWSIATEAGTEPVVANDAEPVAAAATDDGIPY